MREGRDGRGGGREKVKGGGRVGKKNLYTTNSIPGLDL